MKRLILILAILLVASITLAVDDVVDHQDTANVEETLYTASYTKLGCCFTTTTAKTLTSVGWWLKKYGSPTGSAYATIYNYTGTCNNNAVPTGAALATSGAYDVSTISTDGAVYPFPFSGANQIALAVATSYFVVVERTGGDGSNYIAARRENDITATANGPSNMARYSGSWVAYTSNVYHFAVYGVTPASTARRRGGGVIQW